LVNRRRQDHDPLARKTSEQAQMDAQVYGDLLKVDNGMQTAYPVSIFEIAPDPRQPRRQIPSIVRQAWNGEAQSVGSLFDQWVALVADNSEEAFDNLTDLIERLLASEEVSAADAYQGVIEQPRQWGVIGSALMAVVNLAAEIRRDGLTNPITIARTPIGNGSYLIETGERRWLAFHLLHIFSDGGEWSKIPAREVKAASVWRQASENTSREQLNAISMARQLALLLMDLHGPERFQAYYELVPAGQCDRAYYAQVADGNQWRVPRGKGEQLVSAMGIKNPVQLRLHRDLLRLPDVVWMLADDLNWTEHFIRFEILDKAVNEQGVIALAQYHADRAGYRVIESTHTVSADTVSNGVEGENLDETNAEVPDDQRDLPEININDWVKTNLTGDEVFQVIKIIPKDGWNQWVTLYQLHNDQMPEGAEIKAKRHDLILVDSPAPTSDGEPAVDPSLEYWQVQVLEFAYARAEAGNPWFAAKDSPSNPERLNTLIAKHLLRGRSAYTNIDYATAFYSIAGAGCLGIGKPFLPTPQSDQRRPVSGGEFHAGNGAPVPQNPPVQNDPGAVKAQQQAKLERDVLKQIEGLRDQFAFQAEKIAVQNIQNKQGNIDANGLINQIEAELRKFRNRLNGK
jgi:hypothetical protein